MFHSQPFGYNDDYHSYYGLRPHNCYSYRDQHEYLKMKAHQQRQRKREHEEAAARAEFTRRLQMQRQRELEEQELIERKHRQLGRQRQHKLLIARRAAEKEEEEEQRLRRARAEERRSQVFDSDSDDDSDDNDNTKSQFQIVRDRNDRLYSIKNPSYSPPLNGANEDGEEEFEIVRGSDGHLYTRRKRKERKPSQQLVQDNDTVTMKSKTKKKKKKNTKKRRGFDQIWNSFRKQRENKDNDNDMMETEEDGRIAENGIHISKNSLVNEINKEDDFDTDSTASSSLLDNDYDGISSETLMPFGNNGNERVDNKKGKRKRITVIVEDASDSEYEDEEYNSPWRNRRPSPGQWMEPVENYCS